MVRSEKRAKVAVAAVLLLGFAGSAACADAYLGVNDPAPNESEGGPPDAGTAAPPDAGHDGAVLPAIDGAVESDAGTVTFADDFDRVDGAVRGPWDGTSVRNGTLALAPLATTTEPGRWLRAGLAEPADGGSSFALVYRKIPQVLLTGRATFALKIDEFEATAPDGGAIDTMHMFAAEFPCAGGVNHVVRAGLRKRTGGFAIMTASQYIPGNYRGSGDSAIRLTTGRIYQIAVDYDATAPAAGKPIVTVSVDGAVAASIDGTTETAIAHTTSTTFSTGGQSGYGASWALLIDDFKVVARP